MSAASKAQAVRALAERIAERLDVTGKAERQASIEATGSADAIRYIRVRRAMPSADRLQELAKVLDTTTEWLLSEDDAPGLTASLYDRLMVLRQPETLSNNKWAIKAGVNTSFFSSIRRGGDPSVGNLEKVLAAVGVTISDFFREAPSSEAALAIAAQTEEKKPRRRIEATLRISADSWDDLAHALHQLRTEIAVDGCLSKSSVSGGYASGWIVETSEDESITHESWAASLDTYLREKGL